MADKLTPQQAEAVRNRGGKLLVSAAAGSGKTKVLVDRLLGYLTDPKDPANLDEFLIITYTKAAASELRGKIAAKLTERIAQEPENRHLQKQMQRLFLTKISTVHGFCSDILREYAYKLDLPADFRVADENECREIRETVMADLLDRAYETADASPDFHAFVDTQGLGRDDRLVPELIEKVYNSAKCHLDPDGWLEKALSFADMDEMTDASETVWGKYLMDDLKEYLDCQIHVMKQCVEAVEKTDGFEKPAVNLKDTLYQLETLRGSQTWDDVVKHQNIDYGRLTFPRKCDDPELVERVKAARDACKAGLKKRLRPFADQSSQVLYDLQQSGAGARGLVALVKAFERDYSIAKRSRRCLDFADLEHKMLDLVLGKSRSGVTVAATEIGNRFREIMVDEYQDSNGVQDAIFSALTMKHNNCFMVGDVKQSIYQFRLADPDIFLQKYHAYADAQEAEYGQGRKVLLSHNFRSGAEVIEAVNNVFSTCMTPRVGGLLYGEAEALREGVPHIPLNSAGTELYALEIREDTYQEEAAFVAEKIHDMLEEGTLIRSKDGLRSVKAEDIVILLRSPGSVGGEFQRALEARNIRCASGGGTDLLQTQEIGTLRSLLQTIYNPRQDIPLISILASPVFGFTADDLAAFRAKRRYGSVYDSLVRDDSPKCKEFLCILDTLRKDARMHTLTQLLERCFALTRLDSIYAAMSGGDTRAANLQTFCQLAVDFEMGNHRDLGQFLDHLDAMEAKGLITAGSEGKDCVTIMSIHKSKGLEFPVVFLCGLSREFNRDSLRSQILCDRELGLGLSVADTKNRVRYPTISKRAIAARMMSESLSEEMRVLYVAMTRARDRLIMTYASRNLEADLKDIALRMDFDGGQLLCRDVVCPGEWVLMTAMRRTEAGELFAIGGRPANTYTSTIPWNIRVTEAPEEGETESALDVSISRFPKRAEEKLQEALAFRYGHTAATMVASKQTATGRKGRQKDAEVSEHTEEPKPLKRTWREPSFLSGDAGGKDVGTAIHAALQYVRYENCGSISDIQAEIDRLVRFGFLSERQGELVDCGMLNAFFQTDLGQRLVHGAKCLREFKFSILDDGVHYGEGLNDEQVLLQGVVDCAILEDDGITILDFKTDRVTEKTLPDVAARYAPQVLIYGEALSRIYELPIKGEYLYFFRLNRLIPVGEMD